MSRAPIAILGAGNLGAAIADGLVAAERARPEELLVTRRHAASLEPLAARGYRTGTDNQAAVAAAELVLVCVQPQQLDALLDRIADALDPARHVLVSTVSGVGIAEIRARVGERVPVMRAMPNIGIAIRESMTCLACEERFRPQLGEAEALFEAMGRVLWIGEEQMVPATALCACGVAFFLRAIRAASQGGIEIGFHADEALALAAQTAKGAADLLLRHGNHPELEIDRVTTPKGCTIYGLNEMENRGFSSAMVRGILTASQKAAELYPHAGE